MFAVVGNGDYLGQLRKKSKKHILQSHNLNSQKIFRIPLTFQGLIHEINSTVLGSLNSLNSYFYVLNDRFFYTQLVSPFLLQKDS